MRSPRFRVVQTHIHMITHVWLRPVCAHRQGGMNTSIQACVCTRVHPNAHIHMFMHTHAHASGVRQSEHTCVYAHKPQRVRAKVRAWAHTYLRMCPNDHTCAHMRTRATQNICNRRDMRLLTRTYGCSRAQLQSTMHART